MPERDCTWMNGYNALVDKGYTVKWSYTTNPITWCDEQKLSIIAPSGYEMHLNYKPTEGFCGGGQLYYIPSVNSSAYCAEAVVMFNSFIEYIAEGKHQIIAYASDDDVPGQEAMLESLGFELIEHFVSVKTSNRVGLYKKIIPDEGDVTRAETYREEKYAREAVYA